MKPFRHELKIYQGSTLRAQFTWKSGATEGTATAVDLTGYTARSQIRPSVDSETVIHEMTTENGGIILGDDAGTIELYISDSDTAAFDFDDAVYDMELIAPGGDVTRFLEGRVTLSIEVTRG